jgi:plastocyanin
VLEEGTPMTKRWKSLIVATALFVAIATLFTLSSGSKSPVDVVRSLITSQAEAQGGTGTITGKILFDGDAPTYKKVKMSADPACKAMHSEPVYPESIVVNENGTLRWVMVYVKEGASGKFEKPKDPVVLDQVGCMYQPHVFTIIAGQPLEIRNSDEVLHNVHALPETNKPFNIAQPIKGLKTKKKFDKPETPFRIKCDVHPWMACYVGVFEHPFHAVTGEDGTFKIDGRPAGDYVIETWHEKFGTQTQSVTVAAGEAKTLDITYKAGS